MSRSSHSAPMRSRAALVNAIQRLEEVGSNALTVLGLITGTMSGLGFVAGYDEPTLATYLAGLLFGIGVYLIARIFWLGAWILPEITNKSALTVYAVVAVLGFAAFVGVSYVGNQKFVAGSLSEQLAEDDRTDELANHAQEIGAFVARMAGARDDILKREEAADAAATTEAGGNGPTGSRGTGPVYRSFLAAAGKYRAARELLDAKLEAASALNARLASALEAMRAVREEEELGKAARKRRIKTLEGQAISAMRELLTLDPAGTLAAAASIVAGGVPEQSGAGASSRARIEEIAADMRLYAERLAAQAAEIGARIPELPAQHTNSQAEHLLTNAWRMPGLSLAALLFDAAGWVLVGFRAAAYQALRARDEAERTTGYDDYIMGHELDRFERIAGRVALTRVILDELENGSPPALPKPSASDDQDTAQEEPGDE